LIEVLKAANTLSEKDTLVLVLAGHGKPGGVFKIAEDSNKDRNNKECNNEEGKDANLIKAELEMSFGQYKSHCLAYQHGVLFWCMGKPQVDTACCCTG